MDGIANRANKKFIYQPESSSLMYHFDSNRKVKLNEGLLGNIFTKANLYKKFIKLIDKIIWINLCFVLKIIAFFFF